jgi:hypothetical protein
MLNNKLLNIRIYFIFIVINFLSCNNSLCEKSTKNYDYKDKNFTIAINISDSNITYLDSIKFELVIENKSNDSILVWDHFDIVPDFYNKIRLDWGFDGSSMIYPVELTIIKPFDCYSVTNKISTDEIKKRYDTKRTNLKLNYIYVKLDTLRKYNIKGQYNFHWIEYINEGSKINTSSATVDAALDKIEINGPSLFWK